MNVVRIEDPADERIADYRNVPDPDLMVRRGLFVAEGRLVVRRLLASTRWTPRSLLVTPPALAALQPAIELCPDVPVFVVDQPVMDGITGFNIHRGCLALGERNPAADWRGLAESAALVVALERLGNADNVGAIFRNAAAFGADMVLLGPSCADPLYRKSIRTSMGAALSVPFAEARPWPGALSALRDEEWAVVALSTAATSLVRETAAALAGRRVVMVVGHEGDGLTADAVRLCTHRAAIPIAPGVDSLNAATAAAVALYEFASARRQGCVPGRPAR
jgi:tRNA G18 (ribose-2'-O)-methylase SpoU